MRRTCYLFAALLVLLLAAPAGAKSFWGPLSPVEREALIDLYEATDGENWINNEGWLGPPGTECDWHGVSCGCFTEGACPAVYQIDLEQNNLRGYLPRSIRRFRQLQVLNLAINRLQGEVPGELGKLLRLRELELGVNRFTGEIPPELGRLTRLRYLSLGFNDLHGPLPAELAGLKSVQLLFLSDNRLSGELPHWVGEWTALSTLGLDRNELSGSIPAELFELKDLNELSLTENHFTGRLPANIGKPELHIVHLEGNRLSGPIPESVLDLDFLSYINVSWNAFYPTSPEVEQFFMDRGGLLGWLQTQTLAPENLVVVATSSSTVRLTWEPAFPGPGLLNERGGYLVYMKAAASDRFRLIKTVPGKESSAASVNGLKPGSLYTFRVRTFSKPHAENENIVRSELSSSVAVTLPSAPSVEGRLP